MLQNNSGKPVFRKVQGASAGGALGAIVGMLLAHLAGRYLGITLPPELAVGAGAELVELIGSGLGGLVGAFGAGYYTRERI